MKDSAKLSAPHADVDAAQSSIDHRYRAPALDKGLDILELLASEPGGLTRAEIVKAMGRSPGEIYRMLERLVARDYVVRSLEGDRYALSMKMFTLAHRHPPIRRLVAPAQPLMDQFARRAAQSCHLVAPDGDAAVVVAHASCPGNWEFGLRVGAPIDLLTTGSGQVLLAFMDPSISSDWLARAQMIRGLVDIPSVEAQLNSYLNQGYRVGDSQQVKGVRDLSVPIRAPNDHALAVITCPYVHRLDGAHVSLEDVLSLLLTIARQLSLA